MFDLEKFKKGDYFVHLPTQEIYDEAMKFLEKNGISWGYVEATNKQIWEHYKEETAINLEDYMYYADKPYYEAKGFKELPINEKEDDYDTLKGLAILWNSLKRISLEEDDVEAIVPLITQPTNTNNMVKSPNHYIGDQGLEVEEVLRNFIPRYEDSYVAHRVASALEYLLRAPLKNGKQDLEKARYNITQALEHIESEEDFF